MPHIHTAKGQHDTTASAFIVRTDGNEPRILLHVHKKLHILLQPGGHIELSETPWQAMLHEITEETGYHPDQLQVLQPTQRLKSLNGAILHPSAVCQNTHRFNQELEHWHTDTAYAFTTNSEPAGKPDDKESTDLRWLSEQELKEVPAGAMPENVREIALYILSDCLPDWEALPLNTFSA